MKGYKILYVEDDWDVIKQTCEEFFPELENSSDFVDAALLDDIKKALKTISYLDITDNFKDALYLLKAHAEDYLFFIIDRDLDAGKRKYKIEDIQQLWPSISIEKYNNTDCRSGDLLFEYLTLERGINKTDILNSFRFLTAVAVKESEQELNEVLRRLHYSEKEIKSIVVHKSDRAMQEKLKTDVGNLGCFYIQKKHHDVFRALKESAPGLSIKDDHTINMIKALAYVEGVKLNGKRLEKPSISLLRVLGEAFREKVSEIAKDQYKDPAKKNTDEIYDYCQDIIKNHKKEYSPFFELALAAIIARHSNFDKTSKKFIPFDISTLNPLELFSPPIDIFFKNNRQYKDIINRISEYKQEFEHITHYMNLVQTTTSQEIHHNDRRSLLGNRLQLITYAICELLLFYNEQFNGYSLKAKANEDDWHKERILDLMAMANNNGQVYAVPLCVLKCFEDYIGKSGLDEQYLKTLGFEIENEGGNSPTVKYQLT